MKIRKWSAVYAAISSGWIVISRAALAPPWRRTVPSSAGV